MRARPADLLGRLDRISFGLDADGTRDLVPRTEALRRRLEAAAALSPRKSWHSSGELQSEVQTLTVEILRRLANREDTRPLAPVLPFARPISAPSTAANARRHAG